MINLVGGSSNGVSSFGIREACCYFPGEILIPWDLETDLSALTSPECSFSRGFDPLSTPRFHLPGASLVKQWARHSGFPD